ncbi:MAG: hypothetical protein CME62_17100 [Halobacteriovoraceae bacterium]|nr:hypothetical protein [Halobacteriovoraceae bacterium]
MMNTFFAVLAVCIANFAVEHSFQTISQSFPTFSNSYNQSILKHKVDVDAQTISTVEKVLKSDPVLSSKQITSYKAIDFTPVDNISVKQAAPIKPKYTLVKKVNAFKKEKVDAVKTEKPLPRKKKNLNKVSHFELSLNEQEEQKPFKVKKLKIVSWSKKASNLQRFAEYKKLENTKNKKAIARISNNETSDVVQTKLAANDKLNFPRKLKESGADEINDDLVFFDYSKNEEKSDKVKSVKPSVQQKLKRPEPTDTSDDSLLSMQTAIVGKLVQNSASQANKASPTPAKKKFKKIKNLPKLPKKDEVAQASQSVNQDVINGFLNGEKSGKVKQQPSYACLDESLLHNDQTYKASYEIQLSGIDQNKVNDKLFNFDVRFHDDLNAIYKDHGSGKITMSTQMATQLSVRRASIYRAGYFPTTMDLVFEPGHLKANIPVFSNDKFNRILNRNNLRGMGAHLLVELDDKTEDVEIDGERTYEYKFYLDKNLNIINRDDSEYYFVLFIGVQSGNNLLNFNTIDRETVTKIVYLAADEIYYEPNFYAKVKKDTFYLYEEGLASNCKPLLDIKSDDISTWSYKGEVAKDSLNKYIVKNMQYPVGLRKYYELKHLKESVFIGKWRQESLVVPTEAYINYVISKFDLSKSASKCIVQLNLTKPVREIVFNGQSAHGLMNMQINILDSDGKFYQDFSEQSKRVFLMGEDQGVINVKVNYTDNSAQYLQSFCSESTYLIEQL